MYIYNFSLKDISYFTKPKDPSVYSYIQIADTRKPMNIIDLSNTMHLFFS